MGLTSRRRRPIAREEGKLRDARLFVVATEDTYAPKQYFDLFRHNRIHVEVLPTEDTRSNPEAVVERLARFSEEYQIDETDQMWALLDTDHWIDPNHVSRLRDTLRNAKLKGVRVAMSRPCFDLWLLLHHENVSSGTVFNRCSDVGARIREVKGAFNKRLLKPDDYPMSSVDAAIRRAKDLEAPGEDHESNLWPSGVATRVFLLMEELKLAGLVLTES